jgi:hypothetical protein
MQITPQKQERGYRPILKIIFAMILQEILAIAYKYYITFYAMLLEVCRSSVADGSGVGRMSDRRLAGRFWSGASIGATSALKIA